MTKYVKVAFFRGTSLRPLPPGESKQKDVRYLHVHEGDPLDEELVASWIRQAVGTARRGSLRPATRSGRRIGNHHEESDNHHEEEQGRLGGRERGRALPRN